MFMRPLSLLAATLLAIHAPTALAATLYKCVDANGKIAYVAQPCEGTRSTAKTIDVVPQATPVRASRYNGRYNSGMSDYERYNLERVESRKREASREAEAEAREKEVAELNRRKVASALDARNAKLRQEAEQRKQAELAEYERWQKINGKAQK
jgi:hypothetical protein